MSRHCWHCNTSCVFEITGIARRAPLQPAWVTRVTYSICNRMHKAAHSIPPEYKRVLYRLEFTCLHAADISDPWTCICCQLEQMNHHKRFRFLMFDSHLTGRFFFPRTYLQLGKVCFSINNILEDDSYMHRVLARIQSLVTVEYTVLVRVVLFSQWVFFFKARLSQTSVMHNI